ncbi:ubiquinol-cytochrome c reductase iron-sulfur subunit [Ectothiorhodospira mobilis]|uniref:ubiquinol-cytochrome c reductase iron-sulfur subunit n=1 Tax=Ectothiorhodospira mobilis TaxID=195064 RepID=UPI001EE7D621|nr:ubiquinol-cytochrome c reductase iron-sulfur subunit [Ectothiorhodospira mobilis]MCG5535279.1 ubiquinol-cytochrome c reductase iron-sulfur subunit [Ectothiorhodospira mobilis]
MSEPHAPQDVRPLRFYYRVALKVLSLAGVGALVLVMLSGLLGSWFGADEAGDAPGLTVELADLSPGGIRKVAWDGRPVWILRRTPAMEAADARTADRLYDPASRLSRQPAAYRNAHRSAAPEWFVFIALGTDLNCPLEYVPPQGEGEGDAWGGGFVDRCRGSRYDFAGRVLKDQPARRNLEVPPYRLVSGTRLVLGEAPR